MLNLTPHRRLRIPNGMAVIAAVLLLGSSFAGLNATSSNLVTNNDNQATSIVKNIDDDIANMGDNVKKKSRVLKLGLQLFQR